MLRKIFSGLGASVIILVSGCSASSTTATETGKVLPPEKIDLAFSYSSDMAASADPGMESKVVGHDSAALHAPCTTNNDEYDHTPVGCYDNFIGWTTSFEIGEGIKDLPADNIALHYPNNPTIDKIELARVASLLGVEGDIKQGTDGYIWEIGPDKTGAQIRVMTDALGSWSMWNDLYAPVGDTSGPKRPGNLSYASGFLATPLQKGPYPLIDINQAVERLELFWLGAYTNSSSKPLEEKYITRNPIDQDLDGLGENIIVLVSVEASMYQIWAQDGSVWFVPSYRFTGDDGNYYEVPAITDEYMPFDVYAQPDPWGDAPDPGLGLPYDPSPNEIIDADADFLIGLDLNEAEQVLYDKGLNWTLRVVIKDGESLNVTEDYSPSRVNVSLIRNRIESVLWFG